MGSEEEQERATGMGGVEPLSDDALRERGLAVLEKHLGPVQALRFVGLLSREPFDYQSWRGGHFAGKSLVEILSEARASAGRS
jgi:hypothetical protein